MQLGRPPYNNQYASDVNKQRAWGRVQNARKIFVAGDGVQRSKRIGGASCRSCPCWRVDHQVCVSDQGNEQPKDKRDTLATCTRRLKTSKAACNAKLDVMVPVVRLLESCFAVRMDKAILVKAQACKTLNKKLALQILVKGLDLTVYGKCACGAEILSADLVCVWQVSTVVLWESESENTVSDEIWDVQDKSHAKKNLVQWVCAGLITSALGGACCMTIGPFIATVNLVDFSF